MRHEAVRWTLGSLSSRKSLSMLTDPSSAYCPCRQSRLTARIADVQTLRALTVLAFVLVGSSASAQDLAAADTLFNKGIADMKAGRFDIACPAISESYRLDPRPGTLFALAECQAKAGKIASAVARYDDYLRMCQQLLPAQRNQHLKRMEIASRQKEVLTPDVPLLTLTLSASSPQGTSVKRDDVVLGEPSFGVALPVDPGEHVITVQAPGQLPAEQRVNIARGEKKLIELEGKAASTVLPVGPPPVPVPQAVYTAPTMGSRAQPDQSPSSVPTMATTSPVTSGRRIGTYVVGGFGLAGIAVGAAAGGLVLGKKPIIEENCVDINCNKEGKEAADYAQSIGLVSTVGFLTGAACLIAGTVLIVTEPRSSARVAQRRMSMGLVVTGATNGSLYIQGTW